MQSVFETGPQGRGSGPSQVDILLKSTELAVRDALEKLLSALDPFKFGPEETGAVQLVVAEALNNIVEHAYADAGEDGTIRLRCDVEGDGLHVHIVDQGRAMPDNTLPLGNRPRNDVDVLDLPEGGFGWFLIRDLAKDLEYHREAQENHLRLRIAVTAPAA